MITCPECQNPLDFDEEELDVGDEFTCEECGANVRVSDTEPLELELADDGDDEDEEEDDFEDEDDDDEEAEESEDEEDEW